MAGSANKIKIHGFSMTSADIAAEIIACEFHRITAVGSGGSASSTEELADEFDSAVTASIRTLDTTPGADGGGLMAWEWEQLGPIGHVWTPQMQITSKVSEGFAFSWLTAVAATLSGWVCWEEL